MTSIESRPTTRGNQLIALLARNRVTVPLIVILGTVLSWARMSQITRNTIWAEDGSIFLARSEHAGLFTTILEPYAGYLHFVPRIITDLAVAFAPPERQAVVITLLCCVVVGVVAGAVYLASASVLSWLPARLAVAAITVLIPVAPFEILGNAANLHTYFLWAAPWLLLARPKGWVAAWLLGVVALFGALTEVQLVIFAPLILVGWRNRYGWPIRAGLLIGMVGQVLTTVLTGRGDSSLPNPTLLDIIVGYLLNPVLSLWQPEGYQAAAFVSTAGWIGVVLLAVPFAAAFAYVLWRGTRSNRLLAIVLLYGSMVSFAGGYYLNPSQGDYYGSYQPETLEVITYLRYAVASSLFLAAIVIVAADVLWARRRRFLAWAIIVVLVIGMLANFGLVGKRSGGPLWPDQILDGVVLCETTPNRESIDVKLAPEGWTVAVDCAELDNTSR